MNPQYADVPIERPIFVTGLPSHRHHRYTGCSPPTPPIRDWRCGSPSGPQPRPPHDTWADNPVFAQLRRRSPSITSTILSSWDCNYMAADEVEECWQLLRQSVMSVSYECLAISRRTRGGWPARIGRRLRPASLKPAAHRIQRPRTPVGAQEPEPPVRPRRTARGVPRCTGDSRRTVRRKPSSPGVQSRRTRHRGWSDTFTGATWAGPSSNCGRVACAFSPNHAPGTTPNNSSTSTSPTCAATRWARSNGSTRRSASRCPTRALGSTRSTRRARQVPAPSHTYSLADYGLDADDVARAFAT